MTFTKQSLLFVWRPRVYRSFLMLVLLPLLLIVAATNLWSISGGVAHARRPLQSPRLAVVSSASYE